MAKVFLAREGRRFVVWSVVLVVFILLIVGVCFVVFFVTRDDGKTHP